jgi:hypothetical protein
MEDEPVVSLALRMHWKKEDMAQARRIKAGAALLYKLMEKYNVDYPELVSEEDREKVNEFLGRS